jgi:uncharacterized membrane protein
LTTAFWADFRHRFSRGLAAILPTVLTISVVIWLFQTIDRYIGKHISAGAKHALRQWFNLEADRVKAIWSDYYLDAVGFVLAIVLVYIVGLFVASFIGKAIWRAAESVLVKIPLVRQIYPSIKQVTDFIILNENQARFSRVVAVEYPRKGIWSMGLVTSDGLPRLREVAGVQLLTVFIPSSPTPITGYTIAVRRDEVIDLPYSIDEALRFTISGGVVHPGSRTRQQPHEVGGAEQARLTAGTDPAKLSGANDGTKEAES